MTYLSSFKVIAIEDLVRLRVGLNLAFVQLEQIQSHSGTPPIEAVPSIFIIMTKFLF
jgi:hypothetical protein